MLLVEPKPEFRSLTETAGRLGDADPANPVAAEVARLIAAYTEFFRTHVNQLGRMPADILRIKGRWPIEEVAIRLTSDAIHETVSNQVI